MWLFSGDRGSAIVAALLIQGCASPGPTDLAGSAVNVPPEVALQRFEEAVSALGAGELALAEQGFRDVADAYPEFSVPFINLGILHARDGRHAQAEEAFLAALERDPASAIAYNELGILYRRTGRFDAAEAAYQQAVRLDPGYAIAHLNLGVLFDLYLGQPERALEHYERYVALAQTPEPRVSNWVAELKLRLGRENRSARTEP